MLIISEQALMDLLTTYEGRLINPEQQASIPFYANNKISNYTRKHLSLDLDITDLIANYNLLCLYEKDVSFSTFLQMSALKAMQESPLSYRLINGNCYQFSNLAMACHLIVGRQREPLLAFFNNDGKSTYEHAHACFYHMVDLGSKKLTSFNSLDMGQDSHRPMIVFSAQMQQGNRTTLSLSLIYSPDVCTQGDMHEFANRFLACARKNLSDKVEMLNRPNSLLNMYQLWPALYGQSHEQRQQTTNQLKAGSSKAKL